MGQPQAAPSTSHRQPKRATAGGELTWGGSNFTGRELLESGKLEFQAFVGVKHSKTPEKIMADSTVIVVEEQESAVGLLAQMAEQAEDQKSKP